MFRDGFWRGERSRSAARPIGSASSVRSGMWAWPAFDSPVCGCCILAAPTELGLLLLYRVIIDLALVRSLDRSRHGVAIYMALLTELGSVAARRGNTHGAADGAWIGRGTAWQYTWRC